MAVEMLSPGVKVRIMDFSDYVTDASVTCVGIVGGARKGPLGPTYITSRQQALEIFGKPTKKDFGIYALLAIIDSCNKVYYNRVVSKNRKAVAGDELTSKIIFQTKDYTNEFNGAKVEIVKPDWESDFITKPFDEAHPENYTGSDENIARFGADMAEIAQNTTLRKSYFDIVFSTTAGVIETIPYCSLETVVRRLEEESQYFEAVINIDDIPIKYATTLVFKDGSIGASYANTEEINGLTFSSISPDSTMEGWTITFSEPTFINTVDFILTDTEGNVIERFNDLTAIPGDQKYFETYIATNSKYVQCYYDEDAHDSNEVDIIAGLTFTFSGGTDGINDITEADVIDALNDYSNPEIIEVDFIAAPGWSTRPVVLKGISICETRQECMYVIDPPFGLTAQEVVDWANATGDFDRTGNMPFNSSYAAIYWPWVQVYDEFSRSYIWLPPSGHVLNQIAYSDSVSEPWFAPAGLNRGIMTSVVGLETSPTQAERDLLYGRTNCINPIINFQQTGVVIWGQKTTQRKPTALNRVNVRRLVNYLKKIITASTYYFVFDPNDSRLWSSWVSMIDVKLATIKTRRGIYDYKVIMNSSTVTPDDIENSRMPGVIKFKPTKASEYIPLDFMIMPYSATFDD